MRRSAWNTLWMVFGVAITTPVQAHTTPARNSSADNEMLFAGTQVITTATRMGEKVEDAPNAVTVITAAQIKRMGAVTLPDILRYVPDLQVMQLNGSVANINIRGFNTLYTNSLLVMVNNRPVYNDMFGGVFWNFLPVQLSSIKRIEVVRGPGSALYGANAYQGIINIITRTPAQQASKSAFSMRTVAGTHNTSSVELIAAGKNKNGAAVELGASYTGSDGYGSPSGTHDRSQSPLLTLDAQAPLPRHASLRIQAGQADGLADYYEALYLGDITNHDAYVSMNYSELGQNKPVSLQISYNHDRNNSSPMLSGNVNTLDADLHQKRQMGSGSTLVYGADMHYVVEQDSVTGPARHYQNNIGIYLQDESHFRHGFTLIAGMRYDDNSQYGSDLTPRISLVKHLPRRQTMRLSFSSAFQAPTFINSYLTTSYPLAAGLSVPIYGNKKLKPQTTSSLELGWRQDTSKGYAGATLFYSEMYNYISTIATGVLPSPPYPPNTPSSLWFSNEGTARVLGLELEGASRLSRSAQLTWNYTYLLPSESAGFNIGTLTPMHTASVGLSENPGGRWRLFVGAHFTGAQMVQDGSGSVVPAYLRADVRVGYRLTAGKHPFTLSLSILNALGGGHLEYPQYLSSGLTPQADRQPTTFNLGITGSW